MSAKRFGHPGLLASFGHAWDGLVETVVHQRNMRVHLVSGVLVGLVGSGLPLGLAEKVTLIFCVLLIFFAEILNSALEALVDLTVKDFDPRARRAKDAAAGGVLLLAIGTVVIFAALLVHVRATIAAEAGSIGRQVAWGLPLALIVGALTLPGRRSAWVDRALFLVGALLFIPLSARSASSVFTVLTFGLLIVAFAASSKRRSGEAEAEAIGQKKTRP